MVQSPRSHRFGVPSLHRLIVVPRLQILSVFICINFLSGCLSGENRKTFAVRDSAGVRISTNEAVPFEDLPLWEIEEEPMLVVGDRLDDPSHELFRVAAGLRLPDGSVVFSNLGTRNVRHFDSAGNLIRELGREGEGPGEFRVPVGIHRAGGDTLIVWDERLRRFSYFDGDGEFIASVNSHSSTSNPRFVGQFSDGSVVFADRRFNIPDEGMAPTPITFIRLGTTGAVMDSLPTIQGSPMGRLGTTGMIGGPLFPPLPAMVVWNGLFFVNDGTQPSMKGYSPDGKLAAEIHWHQPLFTVQSEDVEEWVETRMSNVAVEQRDRVQAMIDAQPVPDVFPVHGDFIADAGGRLWVERYHKPLDSPGSSWWIFNEEGRIIGRAALPEGVRVLEIGEDYLLWVRTDEMEVERVELFFFLRGDG